MISDGAPSATGYDGENAREHVWEVVREGKKRGIEVLSVGIDNFEQADMYEEFIPYSGPEITTKTVSYTHLERNDGRHDYRWCGLYCAVYGRRFHY